LLLINLKRMRPVMCTVLKRKGFSIVELLVALAVSGVVIVALASGYIVQKRTYEEEADLRDMQMKAQLAMNQIKQYIRNAGLGCEESFQSGTVSFQGANQSFSNVFDVSARNDGPDTLTVVTGFRSVARAVCTDLEPPCTSSVLEVNDTSRFNTGSGRYVFTAPSIQNRYQEVVSIADPYLTLDGTITYHDDDPIYRIGAYTITLDKDGDGTPMDVDGDGETLDGDGDAYPDLFVYDNLLDLASEETAKVVEGVEDIQFQFIWDADGNDRIEGAEWTWQDDPTGNLDEVRAVRIWILVRSLLPDPHYEDTHEHEGQPKRYMVADHLIQLDQNDVNGIDSDFDHHFHRHLCVETVLIRNRSL